MNLTVVYRRTPPSTTPAASRMNASFRIIHRTVGRGASTGSSLPASLNVPARLVSASRWAEPKRASAVLDRAHDDKGHVVMLRRACDKCIGGGHQVLDQRARRHHPASPDRGHQPLLTPLV